MTAEDNILMLLAWLVFSRRRRRSCVPIAVFRLDGGDAPCVRMLDAREGAAFGKESLAQKCRVAVFKDECLQRIARSERSMLDFIHFAHTADPDAPDDTVVADCRIREQSL